ncbi:MULTISPECIES: DUF2470 domain-containing protein [Streptomyces]|uniref:DUF2470 domain-containing protein n=1 Tax=Streptomyces TaxID=1883 RepID=UPI0006B053D8|nr:MULTISPECIES: DUF2470 domain-containing protein [unclassified Streptomyces]KOV11175.1 hypothetical protein ADK91_10645 [Streptomyces sp. XY511]MCI4079608.1 DUF2470 domain-containing protein [Streptomyces sp. MMS21 TC-5]RSS85720.1 DUF2470 domain-containing protein [Streptomyces sp. WAC05950]
MSAAAQPAAEPTLAEQTRSVLARAVSLTVTTHGLRHDLVGLHSVNARGQVRMCLQADSLPAAHLACAPRGALAALVEFTDIAPVAVRDRVRARVTLSGWLTRSGQDTDADEVGLRLDTARATLATPETTVTVGLDELVLAEPDPLAVDEGSLLTHLADAHQDAVTRLTRLADPWLLHGAVRVLPLALDRHGITLRCEYARNRRDLRLPFPAPVREASQVGEQIQLLLSAAQACPKRRHLPARP